MPASIRISSPMTGNTLPQTFSTAGLYDLTDEVFDKIECELLLPGTSKSAEAPVAGVLVNGRPVWKADFASKLTGTYDLQARLYLRSGTVVTDSVSNINISANPPAVLAQPAQAYASGDSTVGVKIDFASGHTITRLDIQVTDSGGGWESQTSAKISKGTTSWGPLGMSGLPGEDHRVVVSARDAGGSVITLSAGAILLN
jgi:hypothetical protein